MKLKLSPMFSLNSSSQIREAAQMQVIQTKRQWNSQNSTLFIIPSHLLSEKITQSKIKILLNHLQVISTIRKIQLVQMKTGILLILKEDNQLLNISRRKQQGAECQAVIQSLFLLKRSFKLPQISSKKMFKMSQMSLTMKYLMDTNPIKSLFILLLKTVKIQRSNS